MRGCDLRCQRITEALTGIPIGRVRRFAVPTKANRATLPEHQGVRTGFFQPGRLLAVEFHLTARADNPEIDQGAIFRRGRDRLPLVEGHEFPKFSDLFGGRSKNMGERDTLLGQIVQRLKDVGWQ